MDTKARLKNQYHAGFLQDTHGPGSYLLNPKHVL